jgi:hypothetical protein
MLSVGLLPLVPFEVGDQLYGQPFSFSALGQLGTLWMLFLTLPLALLSAIWLLARALGFMGCDVVSEDLRPYKFPRISSVAWPMGMLGAGWVPLLLLTLISPLSISLQTGCMLGVTVPLSLAVCYWFLLKVLGQIA